MRRVAISFVILVGAGLFWLGAGGAGGGGTGSRHYWVELDNAFGLVSGADVKVAGVKVGKIGSFKLDRTTYRALVELDIDQKGFDQFRSDAFCESKPQSLIGEYFIDCQPGANGQPMANGATIPVSQTASTVAPDLVNNILRLPYRERLRIILNELGAGVAGQETNINDAVRRAVPALRDTDRTLKILADENHTLADLVTNGDAVITPLARNHAQVGRWVMTAGATARASAARRTELAATFHKLPLLLEQLKPNMAALGQVAVTQTPALQNLHASAGQLTRFFNLLTPFSKASTPAFAALGKASVTGDQAVKVAAPTVAQLNAFATQAPEVGKNLAIVLQHLDDPAHAVETDKRAAAQHIDGRANYTGLEALLQYFFDQSQAINIFDAEHYILKVDAFVNPDCAPYADAKAVMKNGDKAAQQKLLVECSANLVGPKSPGLYGQPDISDNGAQLPASSARSARAGTASARPIAAVPGAGGVPAAPSAPTGATPGSGPTQIPGLNSILPAINQILGQSSAGQSATPGSSSTGSGGPPGSGATSVLNYLLGP
jgi:virulence factor Mce-like protein